MLPSVAKQVSTTLVLGRSSGVTALLETDKSHVFLLKQQLWRSTPVAHVPAPRFLNLLTADVSMLILLDMLMKCARI